MTQGTTKHGPTPDGGGQGWSLQGVQEALDWKKAFFAVERTLSPKLEQLVRTDAFLDALAVANGLARFAGHTASSIGNGVVEALGLPSSRQVRALQRSVDALDRGASS